MTAERRAKEGNASQSRHNIYLIARCAWPKNSGVPPPPRRPLPGIALGTGNVAPKGNARKLAAELLAEEPPAAAIAIAVGGGSQVNTDRCNESLLSDVQACVSQILELEAFAGLDLEAPASLGTGSANREPFEGRGAAQRSAPTRRHTLTPSTSGRWALPS